ncbi:MAG: bifunctional anthranilate synthase component I family protein/class IV aminotransferase, partial [Coriobacteriia bacterium]|nr:bifunctional anthranilate synthase component I family protein/class IV aminotransferase [Coriobacteriia bacterium]
MSFPSSAAFGPLGPLGAVVAPADIAPAAWLESLTARHPLVLAPSGERGWFGGTTLVAMDPGECGTGSADDALDAAMRSTAEPVLCAALLPYDGEARWATYRRGLVRAPDGWRMWGDWAGAEVPAPPDAVAPAESIARDLVTDMERAAFTGAVDEVRERILAGDVYVLNLTRRLTGTLNASPGSAFATLAGAADASMAAAWVLDEDRAVLSASPERFLRVADGRAEIMPVKGTRPRGASPEQDAALAAELVASAKERAEHVMIVDLERNDLGRVCEPGSIVADPLVELDTQPYCHQLVSVVSGCLRPGVGVGEILRATFPCGSVTGAPKIAAMRIAGELERSPRGAYTGALVVALPGALDSSVLIRTLEVDGDRVTYGTGGGITVESDPGEEWAETVLKTRPLVGGVPAIALRETCRLVRGIVPLWSYHRARLESGGCGEAVLAVADREVAEAAGSWDGPESSRLRLTVEVTPEGGVSARVDRRLSSLDVPGGPRIAVVRVGAPPHLPAGAAKPADRTYWDDAQREARALGGDIAVLVDEEGFVLDGGTSTIWIAVDGELLTPPAPPAVAGVARAFLLNALARAGAPARVEPITEAMLESADEVFLTNAFG